MSCSRVSVCRTVDKSRHTLISLRVSVCPKIADTRKDTGPDFLRVSVCPVCPPIGGGAARHTRRHLPPWGLSIGGIRRPTVVAGGVS